MFTFRPGLTAPEQARHHSASSRPDGYPIPCSTKSIAQNAERNDTQHAEGNLSPNMSPHRVHRPSLPRHPNIALRAGHNDATRVTHSMCGHGALCLTNCCEHHRKISTAQDAMPCCVQTVALNNEPYFGIDLGHNSCSGRDNDVRTNDGHYAWHRQAHRQYHCQTPYGDNNVGPCSWTHGATSLPTYRVRPRAYTSDTCAAICCCIDWYRYKGSNLTPNLLPNCDRAICANVCRDGAHCRSIGVHLHVGRSMTKDRAKYSGTRRCHDLNLYSSINRRRHNQAHLWRSGRPYFEAYGAQCPCVCMGSGCSSGVGRLMPRL